MFLTVEWAKRWLPAIFLLLSLFLPWSTFWENTSARGWVAFRSFLWAQGEFLSAPTMRIFDSYAWEIVVLFRIQVSQLFYICFISALILTAGLIGLINNNRKRRWGGLFGILGIVSYFIVIFPNCDPYRLIKMMLVSENPKWHVNQLFGVVDTYGGRFLAIWYLSVGFFLALAGSIMLLLPTIRKLIERLRKQPQTA